MIAQSDSDLTLSERLWTSAARVRRFGPCRRDGLVSSVASSHSASCDFLINCIPLKHPYFLVVRSGYRLYNQPNKMNKVDTSLGLSESPTPPLPLVDMDAVTGQPGSPIVASRPTGRRCAIVRAGTARPLRLQCRVLPAGPCRRPGHLVAAAEGGADVAGPARVDAAAPNRRQRRRRLRGRAQERALVLRGGVGDGAVPELRVQVLLERVVEGVREPRGGLLAGEAAGARAVAVGGRRRRPVVRLGLRHDAPVVPQQLDEVVVRAAGAIGGSTRKSASVQGPSINQWTRKERGANGENRILTRWASSDSPPPTSHCRPSRQDF